MTKRAQVLALLRKAGPAGVTTGELLQAGAGSRYGARVLELRALGHVIEAKRVRDGSWRYTLTGDVERTVDARPLSPHAIDEPEPLALFEPAAPIAANALCWDEAAA
jgi:hypothetical protein